MRCPGGRRAARHPQTPRGGCLGPAAHGLADGDDVAAGDRAGGLPEPSVNYRIDVGAAGSRTPAIWPIRPARIAIEYDGDHHRTDRRQFHIDVRPPLADPVAGLAGDPGEPIAHVGRRSRGRPAGAPRAVICGTRHAVSVAGVTACCVPCDSREGAGVAVADGGGRAPRGMRAGRGAGAAGARRSGRLRGGGHAVTAARSVQTCSRTCANVCGVLGARDAVLAVDHEEGDAVDAVLGGRAPGRRAHRSGTATAPAPRRPPRGRARPRRRGRPGRRRGRRDGPRRSRRGTAAPPAPAACRAPSRSAAARAP